jgi:predicted nucleotide-binding protein (sugar kinase/HSP70/actin superfamily)
MSNTVQTSVTWQQLVEPISMVMHTIEEMREAVFSVWSSLNSYREDTTQREEGI